MYRVALGLLGSTLLAIPTMVPSTPTYVTPQVLRSSNQAMFAMPVNATKEVAPTEEDKASTDSQPARDTSPAYRSSGNSSGGFGSSTLASSGGYGSNGSYGAYRGYSGGSTGGYTSYRTYRRLPSFTTFNGDPNCPCGCGGACDGNCDCPNCTCGNNQAFTNSYGSDVYTGPTIVRSRPRLFGRLFPRRTMLVQSQSSGFNSYNGFRSSGCPSCGN